MSDFRIESRNIKEVNGFTHFHNAITFNTKEEFEKFSRLSDAHRWIPNPLIPHTRLYFSLCSDCKKDVIINFSRHVKYCPICSQKRGKLQQAMKRAIKSGRHLCKHCKKPLPKKYPNRLFCNCACKQAAYRQRKENMVIA